MASYFVTGSSRGLGLSMVTELASQPRSRVSYIFASARKRSSGLAEITDKYPGRVIFIQLDVTDSVGCEKAANKVRQVVGCAGLDYLINNAAANPRDRADRMDDLETVLDSNVIGVRNITRALLPLLRTSKEKKIVNISSALGSIALTEAFSFSPSCAAYKVSKAALNMMTSQWAMSFKEEGLVVLSVSPGVNFSTLIITYPRR
jgi:NAD(P)-dependent dehydrogenase (short-subunit alcohol dehydrogenase family)